MTNKPECNDLFLVELPQPDKKLITSVSATIKPMKYNAIDFGLNNKLTGEGVKIAIIDSGCPTHKDIKVKSESNTFVEDTKSYDDVYGHSTMISGIMAAKNKSAITGFAPNAEYFFAKIADDFGHISFNALVAGLLWAIVKQVDIVIMGLGTPVDYAIFHDAIKKAYNNGICLIASGHYAKSVLSYPGQYHECLTASMVTRRKKKTKENQIIFPTKKTPTTYLENQYIAANGSSVAAAILGGLAALIAQEMKSVDGRVFPNKIYTKLINLFA